MLFLVTGGEINVVAIYLSLIPCVIAYNYFFVVEADRVNASIQQPVDHLRPPAYRVFRRSPLRLWALLTARSATPC